MIKIAICDDQDIFLEIIKEKIYRVCKSDNIEIVIDCYNSGDELIKNLKKDTLVYDILFLDILMNELDGIETAKEIRKFDSRVQIILCTSSKDYILQGYEIEAVGYFMKDEDDAILSNILKRAIKKTNRLYEEYILINLKNSIRTVYLRDIEFVEVSNRTISIHTDKEVIDFNGKMQEMMDKLKDKNFILTHRSYLVNIAKIKDIEATSITLKSGKDILLSRLRSKEVKQAYLDYILLENGEI